RPGSHGDLLSFPTRRSSDLGIVSWFILPLIGALAAIITGHMARAEIRREAGQIEGDGLAIAGLVLGYGQIALCVLAFIAIVLFLDRKSTRLNSSHVKISYAV